MQTWMFVLSSKTLPSAGLLQLNAIHLCQGWLSQAFQRCSTENTLWWKKWVQEDLHDLNPADDAHLSWWRETQDGVRVVHPWARHDGIMLLSLKQHMVPPWASTHILHVQQHSMQSTHWKHTAKTISQKATHNYYTTLLIHSRTTLTCRQSVELILETIHSACSQRAENQVTRDIDYWILCNTLQQMFDQKRSPSENQSLFIPW